VSPQDGTVAGGTVSGAAAESFGGLSPQGDTWDGFGGSSSPAGTNAGLAASSPDGGAAGSRRDPFAADAAGGFGRSFPSAGTTRDSGGWFPPGDAAGDLSGASSSPGGTPGSLWGSSPQARASGGFRGLSAQDGTAEDPGDSFPPDATSAWRPVPEPASTPLSAPAPDDLKGQDGEAEGSFDVGTGPIYLWNPGASTDSFPAVSPDRPRTHPDDGNGRPA
jgi:hypothetical protein